MNHSPWWSAGKKLYACSLSQPLQPPVGQPHMPNGLAVSFEGHHELHALTLLSPAAYFKDHNVESFQWIRTWKTSGQMNKNPGETLLLLAINTLARINDSVT